MLLPPWRESEWMLQWMIIDVVCSKFRRSSDNYERNTGKRQNIGIEPLDDEHDEGTGNYWTGIVTILHD
jgi:hypothetical protein